MKSYRSFLLASLAMLTMAFSVTSLAAPPVDPSPTSDSSAHGVIAVGLSHDAQHSAWIEANAAGTKLVLASPSGNNPRTISISGHCPATGLRWAHNWNRLAVMTACPAERASDGGVRSVIWVIDVHANRPPHKIAAFSGAAHDMQWTGDGKHLAFLYVPGATTTPVSTALGVKGNVGQRVASVSAADNSSLPSVLTPDALDVWEFRLSPSRNRLAYTATENDEKRWNSKLYVQAAKAGAKPEMVLDPTHEHSMLQGMHIALPRWTPESNLLLFLGVRNVPGAVGGNIYLLPGAKKGTPRKMTSFVAGADAMPTWFKYVNVGRSILLVSHQQHDRESQVAAYYLYSDRAKLRGSFFSVPGVIGDGRVPGAVSVAPQHGSSPASQRFRVAFLQVLAGNAPILRVGPLTTSLPPIVASASAHSTQ